MPKTQLAPKAIASAISIAHPNLLYTMQDIYNFHRQLKSELLGRQLPIEAMFYELQNMN
jgi:hypothetical protein